MLAAEESKGKAESPFHSFPEEIWELILEFLENTDDIKNVFTVFPQLENLSHGKQFSWLIADLIPHILPKLLEFTEIQTCRLVSKRWKNSVDKCLENHSDHFSYNSSTPSKIQDIHFSYHSQAITNNFMQFLRADRSHHYSDESTAADNPFPGRSVRVVVDDMLDRKNEHLCTPSSIMKMKEVQGQLLSLLKKFGHHIWYLTIVLPLVQFKTSAPRMSEILSSEVIYCLLRLPNLRSLQLKMYSKLVVFDDCRRSFMNTVDTSPIPANLECLELCFHGGASISQNTLISFLNSFVNHEQINKLTIHVGQWCQELASVLPNLTEFSVIQSCSSVPTPSSSYEPILKELNFANLKKLRLMVEQMEVNLVLAYLAKHSIESLDLRGEFFIDYDPEESTNEFIKNCEVTSIQHLTMSTMLGLDFRFFKQVPSIKYFTLHCGSKSTRSDMFLRDTGDPVSVCVNYMCNKDHSKEVGSQNVKKMWEEFPNLVMVRVENYFDKCTCQCTRECGDQVFRSFTRV